MKTSVLKSGKKIESDIVIVGVGAKPNTDMFKGQIDLLEDKPGGIKVSLPQDKASLAVHFVLPSPVMGINNTASVT